MWIVWGVILIPILTLFLGYDQKVAQGFNLLYFIPTAAVALYVHAKSHNIVLKTAMPLIFYGIAGSIIGACIAIWATPAVLKKTFAVFTILMGINEFYIAVQKK